MKLFSARKSLFQEFVITFGIIIFLPMVVIGSVSYFKGVQQLETEVEELLQQIVADVSSSIDKVVSDYDFLSLHVVTTREVKQFLELRPDEYYKKLEFINVIERDVAKDFFLKNPYIEGFKIIGDSGIYYSTEAIEMPQNAENYVDKMPPDVSMKIFTSNQNDNSIAKDSLKITLVRRIFAKGISKARGFFILNFRAEQLNEIWKKVDLKGGYIWIIDSDGKIVYHPDANLLGNEAWSLVEKEQFNGQKGYFKTSIDGKKQICVYNTSERTGWKIIANVPIKKVSEPIAKMRNTVAYSIIIAYLLSMFMGYLFIRSILKPMKTLQKNMKEVGKGYWNKIEGKLPEDETGDLMKGFNSMVDKISELIEQVYEAELNQRKVELATKKAELQALQTQINPHFLYNTLSAISSYAMVDEKIPMQEMMDALSNMFRYAVRNPLEPVRVSDEIKHVKDYLLIQKYRLRLMPQIEWNMSKFFDYQMLRLTLQPIVENVFKHGFPQGIEEYHKICICSYRVDEMLVVDVSDNGVGPTWDINDTEFIPNERGGKGGIGLSNVHRRLKLAYGDKYGLKISGKQGEGMTIKMFMPLIKDKFEYDEETIPTRYIANRKKGVDEIMKAFINNREIDLSNCFNNAIILKKAEDSLIKKTVHITDAKAPMSEGGIHDFYSNGDYWWPNPDTKDGLPYVNHDGETNPDCFIQHRLILREMRTNVVNLATAYKITKDERYAKKAVEFLNEFFLNESTNMNPHLLYAQAIPGICSGRGIGVIDTLHLIDVPFAIEALKESASMIQDIYNGLKQWFADYLKWLSTHPYGIDEMNWTNNHGVCWHVQASVFAAFTGDNQMIEFCRERYKKILLPNQMALDGSFPKELHRTKPYSYSIFVLDNMVTLCHVLSDEENNLWEYDLEDGRGIKKAMDFLYPYLADKSKWPFAKDVQHFESWPTAMSFLLFAGIGLKEKKYIDLWKRLDPDPSDMEIRRNTAIRQPLLWL